MAHIFLSLSWCKTDRASRPWRHTNPTKIWCEAPWIPSYDKVEPLITCVLKGCLQRIVKLTLKTFSLTISKRTVMCWRGNLKWPRNSPYSQLSTFGELSAWFPVTPEQKMISIIVQWAWIGLAYGRMFHWRMFVAVLMSACLPAFSTAARAFRLCLGYIGLAVHAHAFGWCNWGHLRLFRRKSKI